jgi:hypothetical protein
MIEKSQQHLPWDKLLYRCSEPSDIRKFFTVGYLLAYWQMQKDTYKRSTTDNFSNLLTRTRNSYFTL